MSVDAPRSRTISLSALSTEELDRLDRQAEDLRTAAPGVAELLDAIRRGVDAERASRRGSHKAEPLILPDRLEADPADVVVHQREAMAQAVLFRDDAASPATIREVWTEVVSRLAELRHEAKAGLFERRIGAADPALTMDAEVTAMHLARVRDGDFDDREGRGDPSGAPGIDSGRDEPAPWQPEYDRVGQETGPETTGSPPRTTDQLVSGPGMAGGTGGAVSQNRPADTGAKTRAPLSPPEDEQPPDLANR